jgi:hypothetical protein
MTFPRRIILSRKGFDKSTGALPSPILPDGRMLSLPIPQYPNGIRKLGKPKTTVTTRYSDLQGYGAMFGAYLQRQTSRRRSPITGDTIVHLDPDVRPELRANSTAVTTSLFGQDGGAQGHLRNQCVEEGDLFLFYGYFKRCPADAFPELRVKPSINSHIRDQELHVIWGWLQVKTKCKIPAQDGSIPRELAWAKHHPHVQQPVATNNCIYIGTDRLSFRPKIAGAGVFPLYNPSLLLSDLNASRWYDWREDELSFLRKRTRQRQEHVIHVAQCGNKIVDWVNGLFDSLKPTVKE